MDKLLILGKLPETKAESNFYGSLADFCQPFARKVNSPIDTSKFRGSDQQRYERAFRLVREANLVVAELTYPSTGQGMELRECAILNKQVIVVAKTGSKISGLVKGCPVIKAVVYYKDINDLKAKLRNII